MSRAKLAQILRNRKLWAAVAVLAALAGVAAPEQLGEALATIGLAVADILEAMQ